MKTVNRGRTSETIWFWAGMAVFLAFWELGSRIFGSDLLFPGPLHVLKRFMLLLPQARFLQALGHSVVRVFLGIGISVPLGVGVGLVAGLDTRARAFFRPLFSVISATPVMSVILIAFLILGAERTPIFTAFLMVFPVMASTTIEGLGSVDPRLKELFRIYPLSLSTEIRYLYIPSLVPFILGGLRSSLSLCWKVVVAAEVLVQPFRALGTGMQTAKAQLETAELFAWTLAAVLAAALFQGLLNLVLRRVPYFSAYPQKGL
ncbi:MAG: ABC transporter permease subunit [Treponema sp.]|jgi:NitT/TauT family transport system permease protein|nr:ABC transporter permease subunit [Treponema sp.]